MQEQKNTEITKFEKSVGVLKGLKGVYIENKTSLDKATEYSNKVIDSGKAAMSDELYNKMKNLIKKLNATQKSMNENRKPITQIMDALKKEFTEMEGKVSKNGDIQRKLNSMMQMYVDYLEKQRIAKEKEREKILKRNNELSSIIPDMEYYYNQEFQNHLSNAKLEIQNYLYDLKEMSEENEIKEKIKSYPVNYTKFSEIEWSGKGRYEFVKPEEIEKQVKNYNFQILRNKFLEEFKNDIGVFKVETIDKIPTIISRIKENEKIQKEKDAEKQAALKKAQEEKDRKFKEEQERKIKEDSLKKTESAKIESDMKFAENSIKGTASYNSEVVKSSIKTKYQYEIEVTDKTGYAKIFIFWFENEGKKLSADKIEKYTLGRAKKYAEKRATDDEVFIESEFVQYHKKVIGK